MPIAPHSGGSLPAKPGLCAARGQQRLLSLIKDSFFRGEEEEEFLSRKEQHLILLPLEFSAHGGRMHNLHADCRSRESRAAFLLLLRARAISGAMDGIRRNNCGVFDQLHCGKVRSRRDEWILLAAFRAAVASSSGSLADRGARGHGR
ncbi:hypothetical protein BS78_09G248500 [Paspalum vaginatum]|nr:hypothetical protein BS78_09G248500 [Paspalum vaginatum]